RGIRSWIFVRRWSKKTGSAPGGSPLSLDDARRLVQGYANHYNNRPAEQLHGYITPKDMLAWRQQEIHAERDRKLPAARKRRSDSSPASRLRGTRTFRKSVLVQP